MKEHINSLLSRFRWYRKKKGGKWYCVYVPQGYSTIDGALQFWTQCIPDNAEIIKEEAYS